MKLRLDGEPVAGRRATVLGLGLLGGGVETVRALVAAGARVRVSDRRTAGELAPSLEALGPAVLDGVELALGTGGPGAAEGCELLVANPAVPPGAVELVSARASGVRITSELELFLQNLPTAVPRVALVTGTQGKSTTAHLAAGLLAGAGARVHLGGNIGRSLLGQLERIAPADRIVLEVSSYQLEALPGETAPLAGAVAVACCTNVLADHLERHGSEAAYAAAKRRIVELVPTAGTLVLGADNARAATWELGEREVLRFSARPGAKAELALDGGWFTLRGERLARAEDLALPGRFQLDNALAALGLASVLGAEPTALARALPSCRGLPHRLEDLGYFGGHRVWDNGVSTTPDSTASALAALAERGERVILLSGGQAKRLPLEGLARAAAAHALGAITFGASGPELARVFAASGLRARAVDSLEAAVAAAFAELGPGESVLFSPACASFDRYLNFEARARAFRGALPTCAPAEAEPRPEPSLGESRRPGGRER